MVAAVGSAALAAQFVKHVKSNHPTGTERHHHREFDVDTAMG
jgi:hypothetical protein